MVTQSFWLKESSFREQPAVLYMKDLLLVLEGSTGSNSSSEVPLVLFYSNNPEINVLFEDNVRAVPTIKTSELDFNRDGLADQLLFNISMPLLPSDRILRARLALILRYELTSRFRLKMQTMALIDESTSIPAQSLTVDGDLRLFQRGLLDTVSDNIQFDTPVIDYFGTSGSSTRNWAPVDAGVGASSLSISVARNGGMAGGKRGMAQAWSQVVGAFLDRNVRTTYLFTNPLWLSPRAQSEPFALTGRIRFPEDRIAYRPGALEVIKFAWIQFLAHFVVVATLCRWIFVWSIKCQIVSTHVAVDVLPRHHTVASGFKTYPF
ncbi:hypothetical protein HDU67_005709 [Dinochytrium kinnereticum]|nr:hypothetical protein HDU67_005709 [Dinochytrium kinnereticum]